MRIIKPSFEIIKQLPGEIGMLKHIETCGRVAWKSEDRTTDDSYLKFIEMLKSVKHGSVLEHGTVYLQYANTPGDTEIIKDYKRNKYSKVVYHKGLKIYFITTNYRVIVDNNWFDHLAYSCEPTIFHSKRITVRFICDRGVSHEFVRHRVFSFTQESTRYCNYSKDKFGSELTFICPPWVNSDVLNTINERDFKKLNDFHYVWANSLWECENAYNFLMDNSENEIWKPQQARMVLPNSLKTELIMTGFDSDWDHFFLLRDADSAHPQARELAKPLHEEFIQTKMYNILTKEIIDDALLEMTINE